MNNVPYWNRQSAFLATVIFLILVLSGCGGGSGSGSPPASGGGPGPGSSSFQPRPFPGDYFFRLPNQDGGAPIPYEAYDSALKELFVSNPDINAVDVYSTVDGHWVGEISVPGPAGLSFTPDDSELVIGTITPYVYFADPATLHVINRLTIPASAMTDQTASMMPVMPYAMADDSLFLGMGNSFGAYPSVVHLVRYDPVSGAFTPEDPGVSGVAGNPVRSLDGKHLLVGGLSTTSLELFLYSTESQAYVATSSAISYPITSLAANADGSQFASVLATPGAGSSNSQVIFWDANLQAQNQYTTSETTYSGAIFSRDGKYLYVLPNNILTALNTQTGAPAGYSWFGAGSLLGWNQLFDVDETYHLFGAAQPGSALIFNASQPQASPPATVSLAGLPSTAANPNVGPIGGGTQVQFILTPGNTAASAGSISASMEAYFGATPATQDVVAPFSSPANGVGEFLTAATPPGAAPGPVTVLLTDANNSAVFFPDAYTYGPHILRVEPNVASAKGGDIVTIFAYGLGFFDLGDIHVTVGGTAVDMGSANLNSYANFDYPEQAVSIIVPPGTPGWADITLTTSNGSDTIHRGLQYLNQEANLPGGPFTFAVYDSVRDRFYLTGYANSVAVFDPGTQAFLSPLTSPAVGSGAVLQGEALTPDSSKLLVADPSEKLVVVFNLASGANATVNVMLPSDPTTTIFGTPQPMFIATSSGNRAFVSIAPCIPDLIREINLTDLSVQTRPDATIACGDYVTYPQYGASSADGSTIIFAGSSGYEYGISPSGPEYVWHYDTASDSFTGPVIIGDLPWVGGPAAVDGDGGVIAAGGGILDQRLLPLVPLVQYELDSRLNETGSLSYMTANSALWPDSILVRDTHNGRQLLMIGLPAGLPFLPAIGYGSMPLAVDPLGQKILVLTQKGVSYFDLSVVPLAVGTVSPPQASAGGSITIRGSGFVAGTAVKIGGQTAACAETDSETLSCTVPNLPSGSVFMKLTNPDSQIYSFENAFSIP